MGAACLLLLCFNLFAGSVSIPAPAVVSALFGGECNDVWRYIVLQSRLPQCLAALLCGSSLAVCGLLLQTAFRNPLAGPSVFGITSGASMGVAVVLLLMGGSVSAGGSGLSGFAAVFAAAFVGAMAVTAIILFCSTLVRDGVMLLIIGIMTGYLAGALSSLLSYISTAEGVKSYITWGMGSFSNVGLESIPCFAVVALAGIVGALLLVKPLNALLLGDRYARNLGVSIRLCRNMLLLITGVLCAVCTAYCGPVAFIGLATPHVARLLLGSDNHRLLLPATMLGGAVIALLCQWLCVLPTLWNGPLLPLNAITPLVGVPVIIYIILKRQ